MAERYSRLYSLPENLYTEGAPVIVSAGALLKDNQTGKVLAQLKFKNITSKTISAVVVSVSAFGVSGKELQGIDEYQYLDLSANRDEFFGSKNAFPLPDNITRSFAVTVKSVIFDDGSSWENTGADMQPLADLRNIDAALGNLAQQYKRDTGSTTNHLITEDRDLWLCRCEAINKSDEDVCHKCGAEKAMLIDALDIELLKQHKAEHDEAERKAEEERIAREEEARIEEERRAEEALIKAEAALKKAKKIAAIVIPSIIVIAAVVILTIMIFIPNSKYNDAVSLMNAGQYEDAIIAFEAMDGYKDSNAQITECKYLNATSLMNSGDYEGAIVAFAEIIDYKDSVTQIEQCKIGIYGGRYDDAVALMNNGDYDGAIAVFTEIFDYKDSSAMIIECNYLNAMSTFDEGDYLYAAGLFEELGDYRDAHEKARECYYLYAISRFNLEPTTIKDYDEIKEYFILADNYGDAAEYVAKCNNIIKFLKTDEKLLNIEHAYEYDTIISDYLSLSADFTYRGITPQNRIELVKNFQPIISMCGEWLQKGGYGGDLEISVNIYLNEETVTITFAQEYIRFSANDYRVVNQNLYFEGSSHAYDYEVIYNTTDKTITIYTIQNGTHVDKDVFW